LAAEGFHVLMESMGESNIFSGYKIGSNNSLSISHLEFTDDTLILGKKRVGPMFVDDRSSYVFLSKFFSHFSVGFTSKIEEY